MRYVLLSFAFLLGLASLPHPASAQEPVATLKNDRFDEHFQDEVPVSGRVIAGVAVTGYTAKDGFSLLPPGSAGGASACVQVMSRDGRYWSKNTFELPAATDAVPVKLDYRSSREKFLRGLGSDEWAVLGASGDCDAEDVNTFYLAGGESRNSRDSDISVFVNSGRADTYVAVTNAADRSPRRCRRIENGRRTGFDTVCQLKLPGADVQLDHLQVRILRRRYERMLPPTEFTLLLPRKM